MRSYRRSIRTKVCYLLFNNIYRPLTLGHNLISWQTFIELVEYFAVSNCSVLYIVNIQWVEGYFIPVSKNVFKPSLSLKYVNRYMENDIKIYQDWYKLSHSFEFFQSICRSLTSFIASSSCSSRAGGICRKQ